MRLRKYAFVIWYFFFEIYVQSQGEAGGNEFQELDCDNSPQFQDCYGFELKAQMITSDRLTA